MLSRKGSAGNLARLVREAANYPSAPVPAQSPTSEDIEARYRQRFAHTPPTEEQIAEWWRLLHRHGPDGGDPPNCRTCTGTPHPCTFRTSARAALTATPFSDQDPRRGPAGPPGG
jgi:hypothetical protein